MDKKEKKHIDKKCHFCPVDKYDLLDVHRIVPGAAGGKYTPANSVTVCSNCHRRIHAGEIIIERWYPTSAGVKILHYYENGNELWG